MPIYRITRFEASHAIDVEASSPEEAVAIFQKAGVQVKGEFSHTVIEELIDPKVAGYREETTEDVIGAKAVAGDVVIGKVEG